MKEQLLDTLHAIAENPSQAKAYEAALLRDTLPNIEQRLKAKFPRYSLDCEDVIQDYAPQILDQAIAFVQKPNLFSRKGSTVVNYWFNFNVRIVYCDLLDRLKSQKKFVSWEQPSKRNPYVTVGEQVAIVKTAQANNANDEHERLVEIRHRFQEVMIDPRFNRPVSHKYNKLTVAAVIKRRLEQKRVEDIAAEFEMPLGSFASIWSRLMRRQLKKELADLVK